MTGSSYLLPFELRNGNKLKEKPIIITDLSFSSSCKKDTISGKHEIFVIISDCKNLNLL